jgi:DNA-binding GntR family transcriptional regulator
MRDRLRRSIAEPGADETAHREHLAILAALTTHDPERARTRMAAHLFTVEDYLLERSEPNPTTE